MTYSLECACMNIFTISLCDQLVTQDLSSLGMMRYLDKRNVGLLSTRNKTPASPHTVMGEIMPLQM